MKEIRTWGWSEDQLRRDGVQLYRSGNKFFFSIGDWAKVEVDDLMGAVKSTYPGSEVSYEFEGGPGEGDWERIF